jgi:transposase, IS5 family
MSRATAPQVSFADWEWMHQGSTLDPLLAEIAELLDQEEEIIDRIRLDLERGLKRPTMGRGGLTPAQVLRSLVLMRVKSWDYRELRERIADGYSLRQFTHFYARAVPQHYAFNRAFNRLTPESLRYINELIVQTAVDLVLEDGDRLRVDHQVRRIEICGNWCGTDTAGCRCARGS